MNHGKGYKHKTAPSIRVNESLVHAQDQDKTVILIIKLFHGSLLQNTDSHATGAHVPIYFKPYTGLSGKAWLAGRVATG